MKDFHLEAHKYINVPFRHRGRTDRGLDCVGLLILAAKDCGYDRYKEFVYGREPDSVVLEAILATHFDGPIDGPPEINDVVLLRLTPEVAPTHVGIITDYPDINNLGIIHAYGKVQKVVYHRYTQKIADHVVGIYRWPEA